MDPDFNVSNYSVCLQSGSMMEVLQSVHERTYSKVCSFYVVIQNDCRNVLKTSER